jgi:aliphatic sulfonates family ABC transporter substrate-binding protein
MTLRYPTRPGVANRRALLAAGAALTVTACAPVRRKAPARPVRIGYQRYGLLLVAKARGRLDKQLESAGHGRPEWIEFPSGPPLLEAMSAGAIDVGTTGDTPPIFAQAAGVPLRYVAAQRLVGGGEAILVHPGAGIARVADLKGRAVGFTKGSSAHMFIVQALLKAGLGLSDIRPVYLAPADAVSAFAKRAIDAWVTWDPYFALAERDQGAVVLATRATTPRSDGFYLASKSFVEQSPDTLSDLLDGLAADALWGNAHQDEVARIIATSNGLPPEILLKALRREPLGVQPMELLDIRQQQVGADLFAELKLIPSPVRVADATWSGWSPKVWTGT